MIIFKNDHYFSQFKKKITKSIRYVELFVLLLVSIILQTYVLLVPIKGFHVFEISKNLDLRNILVTFLNGDVQYAFHAC